MRQKTEMYTTIAGDPGLRQIIQNTTPHLHNLLQHSLRQRSLLHRILPHNRLLRKVRAADLTINPAAGQHLPVKCPVLPVTGQEAVPVPVHGVAAAEPVVAEAAEAGAVVVVEGAAEVVLAEVGEEDSWWMVDGVWCMDFSIHHTPSTINHIKDRKSVV